MQQKTLRAPCRIQGVGLHTGQEARVTVQPAPVDTGILFRLLDEHGAQVDVPAHHSYVKRTTLSTTLGIGSAEVCTVEHLMSAIAGLEIDNAIVVVDGPEIPAMDGSALPFVARMMEAGRKVQPAGRRYLKVLRPVVVEDGDRVAALYPATHPSYAFMIDFDNPGIQTQSLKLSLTPQNYVGQLAKARTFGFVDSLRELQRKGLALGANLDSAVGLDRAGTVLNPDGLRYPDEFVRHKLLDAVGDLALAGAPLLGEYRGIKSGHELNARLLEMLAAQPEAWMIVGAGEPEEQQARAV